MRARGLTFFYLPLFGFAEPEAVLAKENDEQFSAPAPAVVPIPVEVEV
jgi:hypothetical protein